MPQSRRRSQRTPTRRPATGSRHPVAPGGAAARSRTAAGARSASRPPRGARPAGTAGAAPLRRAVERRSATALVVLRRLPRLVPALGIVALAAAGVLLPPAYGAAALLLVAAFLGWLVFLSWPVIDPTARTVRVVVIAVLLGAAIARLRSG